MSRKVIKEGVEYEVIGNKACGFYLINEVVEEGKCYNQAEVQISHYSGEWSVGFYYIRNTGEWFDEVQFVYEDVPVYLMSDRPYEEKVRTDDMSFEAAVQYAWKVMKCLTTDKYVKEGV